MSSSGGKKRRKEYYIRCAKAAKKQHVQLQAGLRGFLITCNNREREALREAYNLLNHHAQTLLGPEQATVPTGSGDNSEDEDVSTALLKEVSALKESSAPSQRRFQQVRSGAKNVLFVKTTVEDPVGLAHHIFSEVYESGKSISRFIMRMLPVDGTCKIHSDLKDFEKMARTLLAPHFEVKHGPTYCVMFKTRNNSQIKKNDIYDSIGNIIEDMNTYSRVEFTDPDIVIDVDVICTVCCIGVVKDFNKFRRYNLQEVASAKAGKKGEECGSVIPDPAEKQTEKEVPQTEPGSNLTESDCPAPENDNCEPNSPESEDQENSKGVSDEPEAGSGSGKQAEEDCS